MKDPNDPTGTENSFFRITSFIPGGDRRRKSSPFHFNRETSFVTIIPAYPAENIIFQHGPVVNIMKMFPHLPGLLAKWEKQLK